MIPTTAVARRESVTATGEVQIFPSESLGIPICSLPSPLPTRSVNNYAAREGRIEAACAPPALRPTFPLYR